MGRLKLPEIVQKLNDGEVTFTESFWDDYIFYLRNNHIFLSIFCAHSKNPNTKTSRFLSFLASNLFAMFLACLAPFILVHHGRIGQFILEYVIFVILETIFDIQAQALSSCSCLHRDGVPVCYFFVFVYGFYSLNMDLIRYCSIRVNVQYFIRCFILPILGCFGGCCLFLLTGVSLLVMLLVYGIDDDIGMMNNIMNSYAISKTASLVAGIFPLGLMSYSWTRRQEAKMSKSNVDTLSPGNDVSVA